MKTKAKNTPLDAQVIDDQLVVRIGIDTLAHAIATGDAFHDLDKAEYVRRFAITDNAAFAREVANAMTNEEEDGSSPLSHLIERAAQDAIDDGCEGVEFKQRIAYGAAHPAEKFFA